jgi:hypothetical protein
MNLQSDQIDVLKMKYNDHTADLRFRTELDFKILSGFVTVDLVLAAWLSQYALDSWIYRLGFAVLVLAIGGVSAMLLIRNTKRRSIVIRTLWRINTALELTKIGAYLEKHTINPKANKKTTYWLPSYLTVVAILTLALLFLVVFGRPQSDQRSKEVPKIEVLLNTGSNK